VNSQSQAIPHETTRPGQFALWFPVIAWGLLIFYLSTSAFSADNTATFIDPILQWLVPGITNPSMLVCHFLIRKTAHFVEYAILFWLLVRGPMAHRPYIAFALCACYAMLDEGHQMFVMGRTASLYDVALDSSGALFSNFLTMTIAELA